MKRILVLLTTMVAGVLLASGVALAAVVGEVEPNDSIAGAQAIGAASFDTSANSDIFDSTTLPHATVNGTGTSPETIDYYSFTVPAGNTKRVVLDIDHTTPDDPINEIDQYDPWIELYDSSGTRLALSDDNSSDPGSTEGGDDPNFRDSFIATRLAPGTYYVGVGAFSSGGQIGVIPEGSTYQLHVSVGDDITPPRVDDERPDPNQTGVLPTDIVIATFSEEVQGVTRRTFFLERVVVNNKGEERLRGVGVQLFTSLNFNAPRGTRATLTPRKDLPSGVYQVTLLTTGVTDLAGNPLDQPMVWRFTVGS
jgi:hypothetical protein